MSTKLGPPILVCLVLVTIAAHSQTALPLIRGSIKDRGQPIADAAVFLQALDDEHCAKLFRDKNQASKLKEMQRCAHEAASTQTDGQGYYQFAETKAGWYLIHFLWNIAGKPRDAESCFKQGNWIVLYARHKDTTGKYDTMAEDRPFYFSATRDTVRNFDNRH